MAPYCGTVHYASNYILDVLLQGRRQIQCTPADDLVSLVRSAFNLHFLAFRLILENIARSERKQIRQLWDEALESRPLWKACLQTAEQTHHDVLAKLFSQVVY